jgi:cytochrome b subunit of formate dehydrogenase
MKSLARIAVWVLRLSGLFQLVTGFTIWIAALDSWAPLHETSGVLLTLMLWLLGLLGGFADVNRTLVAVGLLWGVLVMLLGFSQTNLLPGDAHWAIQVLHLLVGLGAMGLGEALARRIVRPGPRAQA